MRNQRRSTMVGAVLDTSVIVAAHKSRRGASAEIFRLWREKQHFQLILSDPMLEEVARVLLERDVPEPVVLELMRVFPLQAILTDNTYIVRKIEADPTDNIFLAAALEGQADYLVSLDRHLHSRRNTIRESRLSGRTTS
jgi:putative PIN family toxin of toxin-antitoxin system